jgi:outer membrane lipoprotein-sorting protein
VVLSYVGQETRNGESVQHIRSYVYQSNPPPGVSTQQLSTMDFYLYAGTLLPVATVFTAYPDTGAGTNINVEIDFSNYQSLSGVLVPLHIQRYSQGNLLVDITVSGAAFNTGLPLSLFKIN